MIALTFRHGRHLPPPKIDRQAAGAGQQATIGLEERGAAASRQPAFGDDDIHTVAGRREFPLGHLIAAAPDQYAPIAVVAA